MELTGAELIFAQRMLPHFMAGKTAIEAAQAVIEDDARIFATFCTRSASHYVPTADDRGTSAKTRIGEGDVIASEITRRVYDRLRAA